MSTICAVNVQHVNVGGGCDVLSFTFDLSRVDVDFFSPNFVSPLQKTRCFCRCETKSTRFFVVSTKKKRVFGRNRGVSTGAQLRCRQMHV